MYFIPICRSNFSLGNMLVLKCWESFYFAIMCIRHLIKLILFCILLRYHSTCIKIWWHFSIHYKIWSHHSNYKKMLEHHSICIKIWRSVHQFNVITSAFDDVVRCIWDLDGFFWCTWDMDGLVWCSLMTSFDVHQSFLTSHATTVPVLFSFLVLFFFS